MGYKYKQKQQPEENFLRHNYGKKKMLQHQFNDFVMLLINERISSSLTLSHLSFAELYKYEIL